jgi:hypothetical protein
MPSNSRKIRDAVIKGAATAEVVAADAEIARLKGELASIRSKYKESVQALADADERADVLAGLSGIKPHRAAPRLPHKAKAPITAILVCSDWHVEELVDPTTVATPSGRKTNEYTLDIAKARVEEMTRRAIDLMHHESSLAKVGRVVIAALGDFITGDLHDDVETQLHPLAATRYAGGLLSGVIDAVSGRFPEVIVATCVGNHGRTTKKPTCNTSLSYEQNLYLTMQAENRRKNVTFQVGNGYHNWVNIDGFMVRLHHGEAIKSNGAVGGFSISANKKIAQWNRMETAGLDVFGHHHSFSWNYGRYISNGSLVGWNTFANLIGAEWQPPMQALALIDSHRGVTKAIPVFCEENK